MNTLSKADRFRIKTLHLLHRCIAFNACIWATGSRNASGTIQVEPPPLLCIEDLPSSFVTDYAGIADKDVVGSFYSAFPRTVQLISVDDYRGPLGGRRGKEMAVYLEGIGIRYLMLSGIESRFGLAWITFYRRGPIPLAPFTDLDAEIAAYSVPHWLYRWQTLMNEQSPIDNLGEHWSMGMVPGLLGLTPAQVPVAALLARGFSAKEIVRELKRNGKRNANVHTVGVHIKHIHKKLGSNCDTLMGALLGPLSRDKSIARTDRAGQAGLT
ncbi:helix-turn-helix transcriptional regulator [Paraburkholderia sediminicola]|uniref:helix-turn-helix transcriptional regulator n=1 Tax=Paraburkholderia sediminicola TaxID=458836 RepID=UPI0038B86BE5